MSFIATDREMPARSRFLTAERRRSWSRSPGRPRNLYRVIVGKQGVDLARHIDELDAASRAKSTDIREKLAAVQRFGPQGLTVEAFLSLQEDPAIDAKIAEKERELQAVKEADQIKNRSALSELALPVGPRWRRCRPDRRVQGLFQ